MAISKKHIEEKNIKEKKSMKKTILACLALMVISICLFVSCNAEQVVPKNRTDVAYIKFGEEASRGSSFSASVTPKPYKDLYWFYTATKSTGDGLTGATGSGELAAVRTTGSGDSSAPATGIVFTSDEALGPFSQGTWTFTLKAYSTEAYVTTDPGDTYKTDYDETTILFKDGTKKTVWLKKDGLVYETESPITVTLYAGQTKTINPLTTTVKAVGTTGIVTFEDAWFVYNDTNSSLAPTITMTATSTNETNNYVFTSDTSATAETGTTKYILSLAKDDSKTTSNAGKITYSIKFQSTTNDLAVGTYACKISATDSTGKNVPLYDSKDNEIPITSLTFYFVVYGGATTTIKGTLNENPYSFIKFDVEETTEMQVNFNTLTDKNGVQVNDNVKLNLDGVANLKADSDGDDVSYRVTVSESKNYKKGDEAFVVTDNKGTESGVEKVFKVEMEKVVNGTTTEKITDFKDSNQAAKAITISFSVGTTYTSGNVTVVYKGSKEQPSKVEYDGTNGILTITITHLSEFVVIDTTKLPVKIEKTGSVPQYFDNLKNAFANAAKGDTITLLNNATLGGVIETTKNVTLDLNGKTVSKNDDEYILVKTNTTLTVKNPAAGQANFIIGIAETATENGTPYKAAQAQITTSNVTTCYATLSGTDGAIAKASANDTVTLVQDVTLDADITINKALTLNMNDCVVTPNDKTITVSGDNGLVITGSNKAQTAFINGIRVSSSTSTGIDGTYYNTLAAAVKNAPEGSTITLFADVTLTDTITISNGNSYIVDLNGKTISKDDTPFLIEKGNVEFKGTGTIQETATNKHAPIVIKGSTEPTAENYSVVTVGKDVTLKGWSGLFVRSNPEDGSSNHAYGVVVNMYGKIVVPAEDGHAKDGQGVYVNGTIKDTTGNVPVINIDGATINSANLGIYAAGYAKWNIKNTTIEGVKSAIEIRAGELKIESGTYTATAAAYSVVSQGNAETTTGAAIAASQHTTGLPITVTISGGSFSGVKQLSVTNPENNAKDYKKLVKVVVLPGVSMEADKIVGTKTGGSTGVDGTYYIDGESAIANGVGASAKISNASGTTFYHTLQDAIDAAESGETITLVDNVNADWLYIVNGLTIDLNNKTLTITNDGSIEIGDYGYDNANVKITNGNLVYNKVTDTIFPHYGIFVYKGSLTLDKVTMTGGEGATGGIYVNDENGASLTVNDSTLTLLDGVGIKFGYGTPSTTVTGFVNIINSTIEGKTYALELQKGTSAVLTNSELKGEKSDIALFGGSKVSGTLKEGSSVTIDETSEGSVELKEGDTVYVAGINSFENAVSSATSGQTIKLLSNLDLTKYSPSGDNNKVTGKDYEFAENVTFDLNGKTVYSNNYGVVWRGDKLTIQNGSFKVSTSTSNKSGYGSYALFIRGTNDDSKLDDAQKANWTTYIKNIKCMGGINAGCHKLEIDGEATSIEGTEFYALWADANSSIVVKNGTYTSQGACGYGSVLATAQTGSIVVEGGKYTGKQNVPVLKCKPYDKFTIQGGTFSSNPVAYLADGYEAVEDTSAGTWTVQPKQTSD